MRARSLAVIVSCAALMVAVPAAAAPMTYVWSTAPTGAVNDSSSITFGASDNMNEKAKITAYQISSLSPGSSFSSATFARYPGSLRGTSANEPSPSSGPSLESRTTFSEGRYEFVVVELDSARIAWTQNESDGSSSAGNAVTSFTFAGSSMCGAACDFTELGLLGGGSVKQGIALSMTRPVASSLTGRGR